MLKDILSCMPHQHDYSTASKAAKKWGNMESSSNMTLVFTANQAHPKIIPFKRIQPVFLTTIKSTTKKTLSNITLPDLALNDHELKGRPLIIIMRPMASLTRCYISEEA